MQRGCRHSLRQSPSAVGPAPAARVLGRLAADALRGEAWLTPKPGLVDARGSGAHDDMDLALLLRSADVLEPWLTQAAQLAQTANAWTSRRSSPAARSWTARTSGRSGDARGDRRRQHPPRRALRTGLPGCRRRLRRCRRSPTAVTKAAAKLASLPDIATPRVRSHGDRVRDRHPGVGAAGQAATGFPVVLQVALPALRAAEGHGIDERVARLDALLAVMAVLDDTCVLHRGGGGGTRARSSRCRARPRCRRSGQRRRVVAACPGWTRGAGHGGSLPAELGMSLPRRCSSIGWIGTQNAVFGGGGCRP